jgi:hypothetical protein
MDDRVSQAPEVVALERAPVSRTVEGAAIFVATVADGWRFDAAPLTRASTCALEALVAIGAAREPVRLSVARDESDLYLRVDLPGVQLLDGEVERLDRALVWAPIDSHSVTVDADGLLIVLQIAYRVATLASR